MNFTLLSVPVGIALASSMGHCIGMCGPLHMAVSSKGKLGVFLYHSGRILGYSIVGLLVAMIASSAESMGNFRLGSWVRWVLASFYIVAALAFWFNKIPERFFAKFFPKLLHRKFLNLGGVAMFPAGILGSLLPCPTTLAALAWAVTVPPALAGSGLLIFGVLTLPGFAIMSVLKKAGAKWFSPVWTSRLVASYMAFMGVSMIVKLLSSSVTGDAPSCH